ncbi:hypothetical protein O6H91_Y356200 [Diphasiastrum complanatum]|nr:hypothetical protein O6H91_Y356200 [Diphasiastrum complanatum]
MTGGDEGEEIEDGLGEQEIRPSRLGLGAKYVPHSQVTRTVSALEKTLRAKLPSAKQVKNHNSNVSTASQKSLKRNKGDDEEDIEEAIEDFGDSRASAFQRKGRQAVLDKFSLINRENENRKRKRS